MICLYLLGQKCLHLTFWPYLRSETYSRKYEKLPNIVTVIHACINITEFFFLKMCDAQIRLCLFTFRPIASKQLNSLTTSDILSWLGGAMVTHPLWVQDVTGSIPGSGKGLYVWFFVVVFSLFVKKIHYLSQNFAILFAMLIYKVYLTYWRHHVNATFKRNVKTTLIFRHFLFRWNFVHIFATGLLVSSFFCKICDRL